jgi:WD40 repeat protein
VTSLSDLSSVLAVSKTQLLLLLAFSSSLSFPLRGEELESPAEPYPPQVVAEVARLMDDLSSESYSAREAAGQQLLNIGEAAWDSVYEASRSTSDLELRYRATELLKTLQKKKFMPIRIWEEHRDIVWAVAFSPDGRYLASGGGGQEMNGNWTEGSDFSIRIWNLKDGTLHKKLDGHKNAITALSWFADSSRIASSSSDNTAKIWSIESGKEEATLLGHTDRVSGVAVSEDGSRILTGSWDKTCILYDARTGKALKQLDPPHYGHIWSVALSPDGKTAAVAGDHPYIRLWDLEKFTIKKELQGHSQAAVALAFSPKGDRLVSGGWDNTAIVWDLEKGVSTRVLNGNTGRVEGIAISADGNRVLTGSLDQKVRLFNAETGELMQTYDGHTAGIGKVTLSKNGKYAASGSWDHSVRLWPLPK